MVFLNYRKEMGKHIIIIFAFFLVGCNKVELSKNYLLPRNGKAFTKNTDIVWASPRGFNLTMDIYVPNSGKPNYPVIIMFHGVRTDSSFPCVRTYARDFCFYIIIVRQLFFCCNKVTTFIKPPQYYLSMRKVLEK